MHRRSSFAQLQFIRAQLGVTIAERSPRLRDSGESSQLITCKRHEADGQDERINLAFLDEAERFSPASVDSGSHRGLRGVQRLQGLSSVPDRTNSELQAQAGWRGRLRGRARFAISSPLAALVAGARHLAVSQDLQDWGGRIRTSRWRIGNWTLSPVREKPPNLFPPKFISNSKCSNFEKRTESVESRASERNGPVGE
jgi:hypothetical protein